MIAANAAADSGFRAGGTARAPTSGSPGGADRHLSAREKQEESWNRDLSG
jgi:hypothetical protein